MRDGIAERMVDLSEHIGTHRLKEEHPRVRAVVSYLKFERTVPRAYSQHSRIIQQQEAIRNTN
jgi:hypothetical protein